MRLGSIQVDFLLDAYFKLDGGAMFGVVPRPLWEQKTSPDEKNRIPLVARPMLLRTGERVILVDTGIGGKWSAREQSIYDINRPGEGIVTALQEYHIQPDEVTDVVFTHLHFDHAGATTYRDEQGNLQLTFPDATYHIQRENWDWAHNPTERDQASYRKDDFIPLFGIGNLELLDGDTELFPGISVEQVDGHTKGLQIIRVTGSNQELVYVSDLVPTTAHLPLPYIMGFDLWPLETLEKKKQLFREIEEEDREMLLAFEHDPEVIVARVQEGEKQYEIEEVLRSTND